MDAPKAPAGYLVLGIGYLVLGIGCWVLGVGCCPRGGAEGAEGRTGLALVKLLFFLSFTNHG